MLADMYQMFVYGKKYGCRKVALVYPKTDEFNKSLQYEFDKQLLLTCFPFDVTKPECGVRKIIENLKNRVWSNKAEKEKKNQCVSIYATSG